MQKYTRTREGSIKQLLSSPYIKIARIDHWFKNILVLPGVVVALISATDISVMESIPSIIICLLATGLVASANYVLNEVLDGPSDKHHPVKRFRPVPQGEVKISNAYLLWLGLTVSGLALAWTLGQATFLTMFAFWLFALFYNVPPVRTKDKAYLDVISESVNNPIRMLLGWYCIGTDLIPPISLIVAYWMLGGFFMATKRFGEYRRIDDPETAMVYRTSFRHYNEQKLLVSLFYYAVAFGLFFGIFVIRYRPELVISLPLIALLFSWYIQIGYQKDSPVQYPERLYRQTGLMLYLGLCAALMIALMVVDIPIIAETFQPTINIR